jgi:hypothetical protein
MRSLLLAISVSVCLLLAACGGPPEVTVVNECAETVDVMIQSAGDGLWNINGIEPGKSSAPETIGLGPMDVTATFATGSMETTTGFKAEDGVDYILTIRGTPPGIFLTREE